MRHKNLDNKKNLHTQEDTTTVYSGKVYTKAGKTFDIKKYLKHTLSQQEVIQIKEVFDVFDSDKKGLVDPICNQFNYHTELKNALESIGYSAIQNTIYQVILDLSSQGNGFITFQKFITLLTTRVSAQDSRADMNMLFELFDYDKTGYLDIRTLRRLVKQLKIDIQQQQLQKMISVSDLQETGRIDNECFYQFMTKKAQKKLKVQK